VQVVEAYIDRIREVNAITNAVVDTRFAEALEEARKVDEEIEKCPNLAELAEERPFLGVPFTTKDCFAVNGLSWTTGL